uniref:PPPDE domain-containing protein n=1 Tax=Meloidogyne incognita TaxID=6306 RepID=A0A914KIW8_MELIC
MVGTPVFLNVYDMYWLNDYAFGLGVGVFHSGIEVHNIEYSYGGHPFPLSGIFENSPKDPDELGDNFKFRESIHLGETDFSPEDVQKIIRQMGNEYQGDKYHLISKNCNHFSNQLSKTLTGKELPSWINRLANISGSFPFIERWIPAEWLTPIALQQKLNTSRNGSLSTSTANNSTNSPPQRVVSQTTINNTRLRTNSEDANGGGEKLSNTKSTTIQASRWGWFQRKNPTENNNNNTSSSAPVTARQTNNQQSQAGLSRFWGSLKSKENGTYPPTPSNNQQD